jgi:hypothetical protein
MNINDNEICKLKRPHLENVTFIGIYPSTLVLQWCLILILPVCCSNTRDILQREHDCDYGGDKMFVTALQDWASNILKIAVSINRRYLR